MLLQVRWRNEAASEELLWSGQIFLFKYCNSCEEVALTEVCIYKTTGRKETRKKMWKTECLQLQTKNHSFCPYVALCTCKSNLKKTLILSFCNCNYKL